MNNAKQTVGTPLWASGDLNGFFGLFSNSLTNFLTAVGLLSGIAMPGDIVFGKIVPGAALSIALGNFILGWFARRMSVKENRSDVTAMPYGLAANLLVDENPSAARRERMGAFISCVSMRTLPLPLSAAMANTLEKMNFAQPQPRNALATATVCTAR